MHDDENFEIPGIISSPVFKKPGTGKTTRFFVTDLSGEYAMSDAETKEVLVFTSRERAAQTASEGWPGQAFSVCGMDEGTWLRFQEEHKHKLISDDSVILPAPVYGRKRGEA